MSSALVSATWAAATSASDSARSSYALLLTPIVIGVGFTSIGGALYLAVATVMSVVFLALAWRVARRDEAAAEADRHRAEKRLFGLSILYLFLLFAAIAGEAGLKAAIAANSRKR